MKMTPKLIALFIIVTLVPSGVVGAVAFNTINNSTQAEIRDRLMNQARDWRTIILANINEVNREDELIRDECIAISKDVLKMIELTVQEHTESPPASVINNLFDKIAEIKVGDTGYVYLISCVDENPVEALLSDGNDYDKGYYVVSYNRLRDGEDIWNATDATGFKMIQSMVDKCNDGESGFTIDYGWINAAAGETEMRMKLGGITYYEPWKMLIGASAYYDDFKDTNVKEDLKDLIAEQNIGETGYIWVVNSLGEYVVSKDRVRDGEDISQAKDANGVLFIQEAIQKAKNHPTGGQYQEYPWQNKDESTARMKLAGLTYVEEYDWVVGVSAYYDDFTAAAEFATTMSFILIAVIAISSIVAFFVATQIAKPIRSLKNVADKLSEGDLNVQMPDIKTKDEIRDLNESMKGVLAAVNTLMGDSK
jgi:HAMP domain-containing protein